MSSVDNDGGHDDRRPPRALLEAALGVGNSSSRGDAGGGGYADGAIARMSFRDVLGGLRRAIAVPRSDRAHVKTLLDRVQALSMLRGFTSREAVSVARLALRGAGDRLPTTAASLRLLKTIRPAPGYIFGEAFVLAILGSLGGAADKVADRRGLRLAVEEAAGDDVEDTLSDEDGADRNGSDADEGGNTFLGADNVRRKKRIDVRVQGLALRLLVLLHSPPPITRGLSSSTSLDAYPEAIHLPPSLLSVKARKALDDCYGVLFHYLNYQTLRPYICHLLCGMTRRKHVRHYRVSKVLALRSHLPTDTYITALLATYAKFFPDLLFPDAVALRAAASDDDGQRALRYPDARWLLGVDDLWRGHQTARSESSGNTGAQTKRARFSPSIRAQSRIYGATFPAPSVHTTHQGSHFLTEVSSCRELGYRLEKLQLPDQLASALGNPMTLVALLAGKTTAGIESIAQRIEEWSWSCLRDEIALPALEGDDVFGVSVTRNAQSIQKGSSLLEGLHTWTCYTDGCSRRTEEHVSRLLEPRVWEKLDSTERRLLLKLTQKIAPSSQDEFEVRIGDQLANVAQSASAEDAAEVINCFACLLRNWASLDWPSTLTRLAKDDTSKLGLIRLSSDADLVNTVTWTAAKASSLACDLLIRFPHSLVAQHACLRLHESLYVDGLIGLHTVTLPPQLVLYLPLFSTQGAIMTLSRLFALVLVERELHQDFLAVRTSPDASGVPSSRRELPPAMQEREDLFFSETSSDAINDCVILLVDLVWRNSGFASVEAGNTDIGLPLSFFEQLSQRCQGRGDELERLGSASHSANLAVLMETYANELAAKAQGTSAEVATGAAALLHGPLTPAMLKAARRRGFPTLSHRDFRDGFLAWLEDKGAVGIRALLNATVTRFIRGQVLDESTTMFA